jgi:K+-sensing histidine kinase KdpD
MSIVDIPTISLFLSELKKITLMDNQVGSHIPGGTFFIHSVKSPLTSLEINIDELQRATKHCQNQEVKELIKSVKIAKDQINKLVDNIPFSNKLSLESKVSVAEVLERLKTLYQREDNTYKLIFNIKLKSGKENINLNQLYFFELMTCLIRNGFESYIKESANKVVIVTVVERRKQLEIQVQDFGSGINALQLMILTSNGYSTKGEGHGFGMWFVKRIVEKHFKRKLKIISEVNLGTIIRFSLPVI